MDEIRLQQVLPRVFAQRDSITSDIWHRDLIFRKGERCLIEAASGTGKSSLCSYLYGYRGDYEGIITFDGKNIRSLDTAGWTALRRRSLSLLFQELRLFPELTALENVLLKNRLSGYKSRQEILTLFEAAGIADKVNEKTGILSFGQQQRVAFIRCLCQPFDFILLDEPVSHLDENNARILARLLEEEAGRQGAGILVTSIGKALPLSYDHTYKL
ncbi:MAG TPA: ATP-binding cassette domain-containing protein [Candidatus Bacteroides intestinavium]|uniref:ATP-binding cassette domain-containing protein n=1 Tax=Candidatus Bacteroides intestinavium TaxID=2838469 RepID=A0A9D2HS08_9BACE|nr:ATP-binding cassette domain-containing protein [Candidatus Bacteroides intestinavium]